jgi:hypothetical protein
VQPLDFIADQLFDGRDDLCQRVPVIRIARQRLGMDGELAALAAFEGGGDAGPAMPTLETFMMASASGRCCSLS